MTFLTFKGRRNRVVPAQIDVREISDVRYVNRDQVKDFIDSRMTDNSFIQVVDTIRAFDRASMISQYQSHAVGAEHLRGKIVKREDREDGDVPPISIAKPICQTSNPGKTLIPPRPRPATASFVRIGIRYKPYGKKRIDYHTALRNPNVRNTLFSSHPCLLGRRVF